MFSNVHIHNGGLRIRIIHINGGRSIPNLIGLGSTLDVTEAFFTFLIQSALLKQLYRDRIDMIQHFVLIEKRYMQISEKIGLVIYLNHI